MSHNRDPWMLLGAIIIIILNFTVAAMWLTRRRYGLAGFALFVALFVFFVVVVRY
jgi:uncharacterized membrane protein YhfC